MKLEFRLAQEKRVGNFGIHFGPNARGACDRTMDFCVHNCHSSPLPIVRSSNSHHATEPLCCISCARISDA